MLKTFNAEETLHKINDEQFPVIMVPFYGAMMPVKVRRLTDAQISACGSISLIETFEDKIRKNKSKYNLREIVAYSERMHRLVKEALVSPTYRQIMEQFGHNQRVVEYKIQFEELKIKLKSCPNAQERRSLEEEIDNIKVWVNYLLPEDFLGSIISFVLGVEDSDIKQLTKDILLESAVLAERGHDNPHDHIHGAFTPFMEKDIDRRAWYYLEKERENRNGH